MEALLSSNIATIVNLNLRGNCSNEYDNGWFTGEGESNVDMLADVIKMNQELQIWLPYLDHAPLFTLMCVKPFNETPF